MFGKLRGGIKDNAVSQREYERTLRERSVAQLLIVRTPGGKKLHSAFPTDRTRVYLHCGPKAVEYEIVDQTTVDDVKDASRWAVEQYGDNLCVNCKKFHAYAI